MYITFVAVVGFPPIYLGCILTKSGWDLIGLLVGLSFAALFLYLRFSRLTKNLLLEKIMLS
jgi:MATE family multidrug resistance protein